MDSGLKIRKGKGRNRGRGKRMRIKVISFRAGSGGISKKRKKLRFRDFLNEIKIYQNLRFGISEKKKNKK